MLAQTDASGEPVYRPAWYHGAPWTPAATTSFASSFASSFSSAVSSASVAPGRSSGFGGGGGGGYQIGDGLKLDAETNTLSVDTADAVEKDNTKPVTSAAVYTEVGNINALLATI